MEDHWQKVWTIYIPLQSGLAFASRVAANWRERVNQAEK